MRYTRIVQVLCALLLAACNVGNTTFFSPLRVEELGTTRAVLRFTTRSPTSCEAEYGTSRDALTRRATDPNMAPGQLQHDHQVPLEDLTPGTTWYVRAVATDGAGRTFRSDIVEFTTLPSTGGGSVENVALRAAGTTITAVSSNFGGGDNDSSWGIHNAIDGQMATEWATNGDGDGAFVTLDLGQARTVVRFGFRSRKMTDGSSIIKRVQLVVDDTTTLGPFDAPDPDQTYSFDLSSPVTGQTFRIEALETTGGNTGAKEIELYVAK